MKMRQVVLALALAAASVASAQTVVDVMVAFDRTAAEWLGRTGKDPSAFAQTAIGEMNAVLPATGLDESFRFQLAGTFLSQAGAPLDQIGGDRLATVLTSVSSASKGSASGAWKDIQTARDACRADLVVVLVDTGLDAGSGVERARRSARMKRIR